MVEIAICRSDAESFGRQIQTVAPGEVHVLPLRGGHPSDPSIASAVIAVYGPFDGPASFRDLIAGMPMLRWIHSTSAGIDDFASLELLERGIHITNSSGVYAPPMVEYVIAMLVSVLRDLPTWLDGQRNRVWLPPETCTGSELHGKRLGVVGYGKVGRHLTFACRALGMEVWACDPRKPRSIHEEPLNRFLSPADLPEMLEACDFVVIAAPLTSVTRGMIRWDELSRMKSSSILVNIARGPIIEEDALVKALREGRIRAAILDVTSVEPLPGDSPLWDTPNLLITPHISGGDTREGLQRAMDLFCANLGLFLDGKLDQMTNIVDLREHI